MIQRIKRASAIALTMIAALSAACSGGGGSGVMLTEAGPVTTNGTIAGVAATGAPITNGIIKAYSATGASIFSTTSSELGVWSLTVSSSLKTGNAFPWLLSVEKAGLPTVWSVVFENDISEDGKSVNINPMTSALLALSGINLGDGSIDAGDLTRLQALKVTDLDAASAQLVELLDSVLDIIPDAALDQYRDRIGQALRTEPFWATGTGLDLVLDRVQLKTAADGSLSVGVVGTNATTTIDPRQDVAFQVAMVKPDFSAAVSAASATLQVPPTLLAFDTQSSWGSAADAWAGFTGAVSVVPTKNYASPTIITFTSQALPSAGWWNVNASKDSATGVYTLKLPEWSAGLTKGQLYSMGFNGSASAEAFEAAIKSATGCRINGDPCVIAFGKATSADRGVLSTEDYLRTFGSFFAKDETLAVIKEANEGAGGSTQQASTSQSSNGQTQGTSSNSGTGGITQTTDTGGQTGNTTSCTQPLYKVSVSSDGGGWSGGFGGSIAVENVGTCVIKNWRVTLPVAAEAFGGAPSLWNGVASYLSGQFTIRPASWASPDLAPGAVFTSGFNGGQAQKWLEAASSDNVTLVQDKTLLATQAKQTTATPTTPEAPTAPTVPTAPSSTTPTTSPATPPPAFGSDAELAAEPWRKDPGNQSSITAKDSNPCNTVRWGEVSSVSTACLTLMETHQFGGPRHTGADNQIELINGKPSKEAFGYLVEWGVYGRKFGVENVPAAQYSKLIFSFLRLKPDGTLMITDDWATLQKDDTGTLLGISDPFGNTWENQERGIMKRLTMLKARFPHLKTAFSVGGWTLSGQFSGVAADPVKRARFIKSAIDFSNRFGFDGIDIDWEYPVVGGNLDSAMAGVNYAEANPGAAADAANYVTLLTEFRQAINSGTVGSATVNTNRTRSQTGKLMLSIAVGLGPRTIDAINYRDLVDQIDTINMMAYDFNGGWSSKASHNAPLYDNQGYDAGSSFDQSEWNNHDAVLNLLWNLKYQGGRELRADGELGLSRGHKNSSGTWTVQQREALLNDQTLAAYKAKMVLGIPFYGRGWASSVAKPSSDVFAPWFAGSSAASIGSLEKGVADAKDILYARDGLTSRITQNGRTSTWPAATIPAGNFVWDRTACANFVWVSGHIFSYDDEDGIYHKAKYVKDKGLGGVMVWEVDGDTAEGALAKSFVLGMRGAAVNARAATPKACDHR